MKRPYVEGTSVSTLTPMSELVAMARKRGFKAKDFGRTSARCRSCEASANDLGIFHAIRCEDPDEIWFHRLNGNLLTAIVDFLRQR